MINQIILSCNEDPKYSSFWPVVAEAYSKMFPEVTVHLAFLTNRKEDDELVTEFRKYGKVTLFPVLPDVPEFSQAKMIRFILASQQGHDVCYIDDIDLFPLSKSFITDKTNRRPGGLLLCVGGEVYRYNGCYPISQMTAEGYVFKRFINPYNYGFAELVKEWINGKILFDRRENMLIETDWAKDDYFSDERLLRRLMEIQRVPKFELRRGYAGTIEAVLEATVDRYAWNIDIDKLKNHGYVNAHCCRPMDIEQIDPLREYIRENYG